MKSIFSYIGGRFYTEKSQNIDANTRSARYHHHVYIYFVRLMGVRFCFSFSYLAQKHHFGECPRHSSSEDMKNLRFQVKVKIEPYTRSRGYV